MKMRFENINIDNCERSLHFLTLVECSTSDQDVPSSSITRGIVLCSSARDDTTTGPEVIKPFFMLNSLTMKCIVFTKYKQMRQSSFKMSMQKKVHVHTR